jgi:hypothetical protein
MSTIRVALADDHALVRAGIRALLENWIFPWPDWADSKSCRASRGTFRL